MKKIALIISSLLLSSQLYAAEWAMGVTGAYSMINGDGKEVEGGETNKGGASNNVLIGSIFIDAIVSDKFTLGLDYIPFKANVNDGVKSRTDIETSVTGSDDATTTSRTQKAQAELSNHLTLYGELGEKAYLKFGVAKVDLDTTESLGTGSKYGNDTIYGGLIGVGFKGVADNGIYYKVEGTYTDYENVSFTSTVARTDVTTNNKVDANLDVTALKISIGKKF
jgi:hypothetical protein